MKKIDPANQAALATQSSRRGFTLVELLVVVAIISILFGLLIGGFRWAVTSGRETATRATIERVQKLLDQKVDGFIKHFDKASNLENTNESQQALTEAGGDTALATILAKKKLLRRFFPQNFTEFDLHSSMTTAANHTSDTESAEVLFYILSQKGTVLGDPPLGSDFDSNTARDTDNDGLMEIVDGWGKPLRFYRWPTRLIKTDGINITTDYWKMANSASLTTDQLKIDQDDPLGKTSLTSWGGSSSFEANYHTPSTYHVMLIISAGQDGILGLYEPGDITNHGNLARPLSTANVELIDSYTNLKQLGGK